MGQCDLLRKMSARRVLCAVRVCSSFNKMKFIHFHFHFQRALRSAILSTIKRLHMIRSVNDMILNPFIIFQLKSHSVAGATAAAVVSLVDVIFHFA